MPAPRWVLRTRPEFSIALLYVFPEGHGPEVQDPKMLDAWSRPDEDIPGYTWRLWLHSTSRLDAGETTWARGTFEVLNPDQTEIEHLRDLNRELTEASIGGGLTMAMVRGSLSRLGWEQIRRWKP